MTKKMKHKKVPASFKVAGILLIILIAICLYLFSNLQPVSKKNGEEKKKEMETFTVICPKLSMNESSDAFLIKYRKEAILIDTGLKEDGDTILKLLKENEITSLKAMILTHYDKDHIGGAAAILNRIPVECCYMTCGSEKSEEYEALMDALTDLDIPETVVSDSYTFRALDAEFTIYPPRKYKYKKDQDNNRSLITKVSFKGQHLLFAGDAQKDRVKEFLENQYDGTFYDFLKVPHHGKDVSSLKHLFKKFVPNHAVITSSKGETEEDEVTQFLAENGVETWLTREGDITFSVTEDGIEAEQGDRLYKEEPDLENAKATQEEVSEKKQEEKVKVTAPAFSKESGFYDKAFSLKIEVPQGTKVYYTLDGSTPDVHSSLYKKEIAIKDCSSNKNIYCMSSDFWPYRTAPAQEGEKEVYPGYYARYESIKKKIDKCAVVRAVAIDEKGNASDVKTASYFVGFDQKKGYDNISVLSLVSDPDGLFSEKNGIMVNGTNYMKALKAGKLDGVTDTIDIRDYTNAYTGRGREWERPVHMDYFQEGGKSLSFSQEVGLRLHGNQSRIATPTKSFNLYVREEYDGNQTFLAPFYEDGVLSGTVTLLNGLNVRNYYLSGKADGRSMYTQKYRMVQVFLDGEYWGMYALQERYNSKEYMRSHYDLDTDEYTLLSGKGEGFELKHGEEKITLTSFRMLKAYVAEHDLSDKREYKKVCSMMDVQSYIDNYALRVYTGDQDWSWYKNVFMAFFENKWHWIPYDMDYGVGSHEETMVSVNTFTTHRVVKTESLKTDPLFPHLMKNEEFRNAFINTFMDYMNETFAYDHVADDRKEFLTHYKDAMEKALDRYPVTRRKEQLLTTGSASFKTQWDGIADYFKKRPAYALKYLKDYFKIKKDVTKVTIKISDVDGGRIKLNTITPALSEEGSWQGQYFIDSEMTLTALPKDGWRFIRWECQEGSLSDKEGETTKLTPKKGCVVTATFAKRGLEEKKQTE